MSMNLNGSEFYYKRNAQGDIIGLFNKYGTEVVSYTYDSWGKLISIDGVSKDYVGIYNPYRYRGYRYDSETGLYYLQSRYYNSEWGRFINADGLVGITGELLSHNMFAYCNNNPVMNADSSGYFLDTILDVVSIGMSIWDLVKDPSALNVLFLVWDIGAAVLPFIPGSYIKKGATYIDDVVDAVCFTGETLIKTKDEYKEIKDIKEGDIVYSENTETGEKGLKKVKRVFINETDKIVHIISGNEEIQTTESHPFWVNEKVWILAGELTKEDKIVSYYGKVIKVDNVYVEKLEVPITVYNFEVEDWHTYFVSENDILVHNKCWVGEIIEGASNLKVKSLIKNDPGLIKQAEKMGKNEAIQAEANKLIREFLNGNKNPGKGSKNLFKDICYLRGQNGARVFYRIKDGAMEIVGKSSKANEQKVINILKKLYD